MFRVLEQLKELMNVLFKLINGGGALLEARTLHCGPEPIIFFFVLKYVYKSARSAHITEACEARNFKTVPNGLKSGEFAAQSK